MGEELCRVNGNYRLGIIWGLKSDQKLQVFSMLPELIWDKEVNLSERGKLNIVEVVYQEEKWARDQKNKSGIYYKSMECFKSSDRLSTFLIDNRFYDLSKLKNDVREKIGVGKHAIHICDDHVDTMRIFEMLNNKNSIHLINNANTEFWPSLNERLTKLFYPLCDVASNIDPVLIDGTASLELYGLRRANDIDLITTDNLCYENIRSRKDDFHQLDWNELIYDPKKLPNI